MSERRDYFSPIQAQRGQVVMEYVLIVTVVAIVMFVPMPDIGVPEFAGRTPAEVLATAFRNFFRGFSFLTSVL